MSRLGCNISIPNHFLSELLVLLIPMDKCLNCSQEGAGDCETVLREEERVLKKDNPDGTTWRKIYFGNGAHYKNWLDQCIEIYGEENVQVESIDHSSLPCFRSNSIVFRIWVRDATKWCKNSGSAPYISPLNISFQEIELFCLERSHWKLFYLTRPQWNNK